jgi:hypothetical protein
MSSSSSIVVASIAIAGTIIGSLIGGIAATLTARGNRKSQEKAILLQYGNEHQELLRSNRIEIFIEFLTAVDRLDDLRQSYVVYHNHTDTPKPEPPSHDAFDKACSRIWVAYRKISLLSAKEVEGLALAYAQHHVKCAGNARDNKAVPPRPEGVTAGALSKLMRIELGVEGGREVSLATGLYQEPIGSRDEHTPGADANLPSEPSDP